MTYSVKYHNAIHEDGLDIIRTANETVSINQDSDTPDALLLRSYKLPNEEVKDEVKCIARAGAGTNNVDVNYCSSKGVVVFNTPGANANAVTELVMCSLLMAYRKIPAALEFIKQIDVNQAEEEFHKLIENQKKQFRGEEIRGKSLGIIGLGAIGSRIAEISTSYGMKVMGYDPAISIENAWRLPSSVIKCDSMAELLNKSDVITLHVPLMPATIDLIDAQAFKNMKNDAILLNFARAPIVNEQDLILALQTGALGKYVCDTPSNHLAEIAKESDKVICLPHLGASTAESERNCSIMAANQLVDFLRIGNIKNSVNFSNTSQPFNANASKARICLANKNIPNVISSVTSILSDRHINVTEMINKSRYDYAWNIIDVDRQINPDVLTSLEAIEGVIRVRYIVPK